MFFFVKLSLPFLFLFGGFSLLCGRRADLCLIFLSSNADPNEVSQPRKWSKRRVGEKRKRRYANQKSAKSEDIT